jgi:hypothetical protein
MSSAAEPWWVKEAAAEPVSRVRKKGRLGHGVVIWQVVDV